MRVVSSVFLGVAFCVLLGAGAYPTCQDVIQHTSCQLLPSIERCGQQPLIPSGRVLGGAGARLGEYPWVARLGYIQTDMYRASVTYRCGGAVISNKYVLTAAHCCLLSRKHKLVVVRLGQQERSSNSSINQDYKVESFTIHDKYNFTNLQHDICLLRLKYSIEYSKFISPICLPYSKDLLTAAGVTYTLEVAGWGKNQDDLDGSFGYPEVMQTLRMPLVAQPLCQWLYQLMDINISTDHLCAGGVPGENVCGGDSGGPLMAKYSVDRSTPRYFALGVTSFAQTRPCGGKFPSVYVNVLKYTRWILDNMEP